MREDTTNVLRITTLRVERLLGISPAGALLYEPPNDFGPGVTVVLGPNGVGKTTTASAIKWILWPASLPAHAQLAAGVETDGQRRVAEVYGKAVRWYAHGDNRPETAPGVPDSAYAGCYCLAIDDLLRSEDRDLARRIETDLDGGLNLRKAREALAFTTKVSGLGGPEKALRKAHRDHSEALAEQERFEEAERQLKDAERALREARQAQTRLGQVLAAIELRESEAALQATETALAEMPDGLRRLRDDDAVALDRIWRALDETTELLEEKNREHAALAAQDLPDCHITEDDVEALRRQVQDLRTAAGHAEALRQECAAREGACVRAREDVGPAVTEDHLGALRTATDLPADIRDAVTEYEAAQAALNTAQRRLRSLEPHDEAGDDTADLAVITSGVRLLRLWLRSPTPRTPASPELRDRLWIAAAAAAVAAAACALWVHPVCWAFTLASVLAAAVLRPARGPAAEDSRSAVAAGFDDLRLPAPAAWTEAAVQERLRELEALSDRRREQERREDAYRRAQLELEDARTAAEEHARRVADVREAWGLQPELSTQGLRDLVGRLDAWRRASRDHAETVARASAANQAVQDLRDTVSARIRRFLPDAGVDSVATADDLVRKLSRCRVAQERLHTLAAQDLPALEAQHKGLCRDRDEILARLGLAGHDRPQIRATLDAWSERLDECVDAGAAVAAARSRHASAAAAWGDVPDEEQRALEDMPNDALTELRDALQATADGAVEAAGERGRRAEAVARWRASRKVETTRWGLDEAAGAVEAACGRQTESLVGALVGDLVRKRCETQGSQLLTCASTYLGRFTRQRYARIEIDADGGFRVVDPQRGALTPNGLSSGTRAQLLLAIRLALLDNLEGPTGLRLPLLLDEVLCNSDDQATEAIIDALCDVAADGRQIIYFTAQRDEAGKWQARAAERSECSLRVITLPVGRDTPPDIPIAGDVGTAIPEPRPAEPWSDYVQRLGLAPFAPGGDRGYPDVLPLWMLVRDPQKLHPMLVRGFTTWGQFQRLRERGGQQTLAAILGPSAPAVYALAQARVSCLECLLQEWRIGRGRSVTPDMITGGKQFVAQMRRLAADCGYDADELLRRAPETKGVGPRKVEKLRESLLAAGALPTDAAASQRRSADDLRVALTAHIHNHVAPELREAVSRERDQLLAWFPSD